MPKPKEFKFIIKRRDNDNTRWKVVPDENNPGGKPTPGDELHWEFANNENYSGLEAHFQFCHGVQQNLCFIESNQINADWAASIPDHVSGEYLRGKMRPGAPASQRLHYAVWIVDPDGPDRDGRGINDFAIGENPPPHIDTHP